MNATVHPINPGPRRAWLVAECALLFAVLPLALGWFFYRGSMAPVLAP